MAIPSPTDLCEAAHAGDLDALKRAIAAGANLDAGQIANSARQVPLVLAAGKRHVDCIRALLEAGAAVDAADWRGTTAAMIAAFHESQECLSVLIAAGADVNLRDRHGMTAAMLVARYGAQEDSPCLRMLIEAGADLRPADMARRTAATHAKIGGKPQMSAFIKSHIAALAERKKIAKAMAAKAKAPKRPPLRM